jgi:hypothetical protein
MPIVSNIRQRRKSRFFLMRSTTIWMALATGIFNISSADDTFFESRIRPVLVRECLDCHGPENPKSGLSLHTRQGMLKGGDQGPAVVPGKVDESLLITAMEHRDDLKMPPKRSRLEPGVIADMKTWIQSGAAFPDQTKSIAKASNREKSKSHWSFQPIKPDSEPPQPNTNLVDKWLDRAINLEKLAKSPQADRRSLLRRASNDLTGLPPTPEQMQLFINDKRDLKIAFADQVDQLLASARFGERWARHWLDLARYSDTKGYVFFEEANFPWSYTYRDYVIKAFNNDKPFNQFIQEQIAADQLPGSGNTQNLAALGYLTLGGRYMNNPHDIIDDRIDVVTRPLLGLSVACARCHDHKFDPISAKDYYALYAVFANSVEPPYPPALNPIPQIKASQDAEEKIRADYEKLKAFVDSKYDQLVETARRRSGDYLMAAEKARKAPKTEDFMLIADGGDLNPSMIVRFQAFLEQSRKQNLNILNAWNRLADASVKDFNTVLASVNADETNGLLKRKLAENPPRNLDDLARIYTSAFAQAYGTWRDYVLRFESSGKPVPSAHPDQDIESLRLVMDGPQSPTRVARNPQGDLTLLPDRASQAQLQSLISELEKSRRAAHAPARPQMLVDRSIIEESRVFIRGNPQNQGDAAPRQFLEMFQHNQPPIAFPKDRSGRLELALSITDPKNPLAARVYVNRVWSYLFSTGIVTTLGDFGLRGEHPSHPELLDALANDFIQSGGSTKSLIRKLMNSSAYQRSSVPVKADSGDPENRNYAYQNQKRLDFESMRDSLLFVSGLLDLTEGGTATGEAIDFKFRRRGIYGKIDRLNLPEQLRTFDFPDPNTASVDRSTTTTPAQSLFLLNHPLLQSSAEGLVQKAEKRAGTDDIAIVRAMAEHVWQRELDAMETSDIRNFLSESGLKTPEERRKALISIAQSFLISNEFHFID